MKSDLEATGSQFFLNSYTPGAFPVLVRIFQFSTEVSLRLAQEFLRDTLEEMDTNFFFQRIIHVTFLTLWNLNFFIWAGPRSEYLAAKLDLRGFLSPCSDGLWFFLAYPLLTPPLPQQTMGYGWPVGNVAEVKRSS